MDTTTLRDFRATDAPLLNDVALAAFLQFKDQDSDWPAVANGVSKMSDLADSGEVIVAESDDQIIGGVVYVPGGKPKAAYFDQSWPIIRMLVVAPEGRGRGIGRKLTEECIRRARRDGAPLIALHTTPIMTVAQPMYLRMGFEPLRKSPPIFGVPYAIYTKSL